MSPMVRMRARKLLAGSALALLVVASSSPAPAQVPPQAPPQQPYPPPPQQPYPAQQPLPAPPPQAQPYPPPLPPPQQPYPAPYPQQPAPQPYPQQPYGPPPQYGQPPPGYGPQPMPAPYQLGPVPQPSPPPQNQYRSPGEMLYLYGVGIAYGVGTGIWIDSLASINDPGLALIAPLALGAAVPIGFYAWDYNAEFERGVASSLATGLLLGGVEGIAISGLQWQFTGGENGGPNQWRFSTQTTVTFLAASAGGVGGYAFGEWLHPDPRSLGFIASGAGWGALAGALFGAGVVNGDWKDGSAVWGFAGYNAGILATGLVSTVYTPSWQTLKYMWIGDVLGTLATTPVYLFYIGSSADPRHGLIVNSLGGLVGIGVAAALTGSMSDSGTSSWRPPFQFAVAPTERGGAQLSAFGQF